MHGLSASCQIYTRPRQFMLLYFYNKTSLKNYKFGGIVVYVRGSARQQTKHIPK
jgi:hypothetical protein